MEIQTIITIIELCGTFAFAISGVTVASRNQLDLFGAVVVAFVTALGGGTLRDVLIGNTPVSWMLNKELILIVLLGIIAGLILRKQVGKWPRTYFIFDTVGIGLFSVMGVEQTLSHDLSPAIALIMGPVSAVFGGVLRDVLVNRVPLIFRKEIYASACLAGAGLYLGLMELNCMKEIAIVCSIGLVITIRRISVVRNWSLPMPN